MSSYIGYGMADSYLLQDARSGLEARRSRRGHGSEGHDAYVAQRRAQKISYAQRLASAEAWLRDCPPLPAARVPNFEAPRRRP